MKKFIALLLALVMTFSVATIAFAADETTDAPETETTVPSGEGEAEGEGEFDLGELQWILDLPLWTLKPMLKVAKIALKFVKIYLKLSEVFGNIPDGVADQIEQMVLDIIEKTQNSETTEPETTTAAAVA